MVVVVIFHPFLFPRRQHQAAGNRSEVKEYREVHTFQTCVPFTPLLCFAVHQCHDVADMAKVVDVLHGIPYATVLREEGAGLSGGQEKGRGAVDRWQVGRVI